ncbi:response regulator receiver protein [Shewanella sediminis HAW-EB3]|uniref:Response regulator receiver protein n=1 Tax=Shewanella sediminis (strain HAW-EB3) TaxID=425104 RepID=A8FRX3_SHESH|nr:response regulator [Shewanella sediminis]ABV35596.1 response regulator receiver protein [Shewanella sediminis HAW-EB3]
MTKQSHLACRNPKVIMIYENEEDVLGAASIIADQVEEYRTILVNFEIGDKVKNLKPSVILFALTTVQKSIELYTKLISDKFLDYPHYSILLCKNRESATAFRCCIKDIFDNYFVYQPLYEKFRLKMIVHSGLLISQATSHYAGLHEEQLENIGQELVSLIDKSSECKQSLLGSIAICKQSLNEPQNLVVDKELDTNLSSKKLMENINKSHVEPLLAELEDNIKSSLDSMIQQLLSKQVGIEVLEAKLADLSRVLPPDRQTVSEALSESSMLTSRAENVEVQKPKKILVVEDNQIYRDMLVRVLAKENFLVDEAEDGLNALQKIRNNQYALVLMDLFMPNLDGINTTIQIKSVSGGKELPIIALTGNKNKELIKTWAEQGLKGYILKPSTRNEILEAVNRVIN